MRLREGFGTPCDPLYSGFVEVFHMGEWGAICTGRDFATDLVADVVCRQLGFPHGTSVDPSTSPPIDRFTYYYYYFGTLDVDEAEEAQDRFWLNEVTCRGPEAALVDCDLGQGFLSSNSPCSSDPSRFTVACRMFAVSEALEDVTTPGAGALEEACCSTLCLF